jgi:hypothetical protein
MHLYIGVIETTLLQVKYAIQYMRRKIQKKAKFDIMDLNTIKVDFFPIELYLTEKKMY